MGQCFPKFADEKSKAICLLMCVFCVACSTAHPVAATSESQAIRGGRYDGYAYFLALVQVTPYRTIPEEEYERQDMAIRSLRGFVFPSFNTMVFVEATEYNVSGDSDAIITLRAYDTVQNNKKLPPDADPSTFIGKSVVKFKSAPLTAEEFSFLFDAVEKSGFLSHDNATRESRWPLRDDSSDWCFDGTSFWIEAKHNAITHYLGRHECDNGYVETFDKFAEPLFAMAAEKMPVFSELVTQTAAFVVKTSTQGGLEN